MIGRRLAAAVVVGMVILAGCGGGGDKTTEVKTTEAEGTAGGKGEAATFDLASAAKENCTKVESGRMVITMALSGGDLPREVKASFAGEFDNKARRSHLRMDFGQLAEVLGAGEDAPPGLAAGLGDMEIVVDGDTTYLKSGFFGALFGSSKPWVKFTKGQTGGSSFSTGSFFTDSCDVSEVLAGVIGDVEKVGTENVNGAKTTHFRAKVDIVKAAEAAGAGESAQGWKELVQSTGTKDVTVDVWLDGDGFMRRLSFSLADFDIAGFGGGGTGGAPGGTAPGAKKVSATFTIDITDVNKPVKIELPPADQVAEPGGLFGGSIPSVPEAPGE